MAGVQLLSSKSSTGVGEMIKAGYEVPCYQTIIVEFIKSVRCISNLADALGWNEDDESSDE